MKNTESVYKSIETIIYPNFNFATLNATHDWAWNIRGSKQFVKKLLNFKYAMSHQTAQRLYPKLPLIKDDYISGKDQIPKHKK